MPAPHICQDEGAGWLGHSVSRNLLSESSRCKDKALRTQFQLPGRAGAGGPRAPLRRLPGPACLAAVSNSELRTSVPEGQSLEGLAGQRRSVPASRSPISLPHLSSWMDPLPPSPLTRTLRGHGTHMIMWETSHPDLLNLIAPAKSCHHVKKQNPQGRHPEVWLGPPLSAPL